MPPDMTLRDWFAGQVIAAVMASNCEWQRDGQPTTSDSKTRARFAYWQADAMMKEREKKV